MSPLDLQTCETGSIVGRQGGSCITVSGFEKRSTSDSKLESYSWYGRLEWN